MGKTTSAIITLILRKNKTLSNGMHPIHLRVAYHGRRDVSTGCSCTESDWDSEKEIVKNKKFPNQAQINKIITTLKQNVVNLKMDFEINKTPYTAEKLLKEGIEEKVNWNSQDVYLYIENLLKKKDKYNTQKTYAVTLSLLKKFSNKSVLLFSEITPNFCADFGKYMKNERKMTDGSIRTIFSKISAIFNFAIDEELILPQFFPFRKFKYFNVYKKSNRKTAITNDQMFAIHGLYASVLNYGNNVGDLEQRSTELHAMAIYLFGWLANGLALVDIARIKTDMIKNVELNGEHFYKIETSREKTSVEVDILIKKDIYAESIIPYMLKNAHDRENYLFPILQNIKNDYKYTTERELSLGVGAAGQIINRKLKRIVVKVNTSLIEWGEKHKIAHGELLPKNLTFYSMRHSFATSAIKNGMHPTQLATLMGRGQSGIYGYVNSILSDEEMAKAKKDMYYKEYPPIDEISI